MLQRLKSYNNVTSNIHVYKSLIVVRYLVKLKLKKAIPHDKTKQSYRYNTIIHTWIGSSCRCKNQRCRGSLGWCNSNIKVRPKNLSF